ncbi:hypothetical protein [Streptomyces zaomyceticus]|uniref:hypothetical protein n=1 Tax=Streptomyces zaomyceticus TaxID=68286 RepID=UPI00343BB78F
MSRRTRRGERTEPVPDLPLPIVLTTGTADHAGAPASPARHTPPRVPRAWRRRPPAHARL